jgi:hypothetical protein
VYIEIEMGIVNVAVVITSTAGAVTSRAVPPFFYKALVDIIGAIVKHNVELVDINPTNDRDCF